MVHYSGEGPARHVEPVGSAALVLERIQRLLAEHPGCERIEVRADHIRLFAVDCAGNRLP